MSKQAMSATQIIATQEGLRQPTTATDVMEQTAEQRRVKASELKLGDRFVYGELPVTVINVQDTWVQTYNGWYLDHDRLDPMYPNGIPLLEPEKPKEWTIQLSYRCLNWWWSNMETIDQFILSNLDPAKTYDVTIRERGE